MTNLFESDGSLTDRGLELQAHITSAEWLAGFALMEIGRLARQHGLEVRFERALPKLRDYPEKDLSTPEGALAWRARELSALAIETVVASRAAGDRAAMQPVAAAIDGDG
jgi:hypothetical protein